MNRDFKEIEEKLESIKLFYINDSNELQFNHQAGLHTGKAGIILLLSLYYQTLKDDELKNVINKRIDSLIEALETSNDFFSGFCGGLAGIGWLFCYLSNKGIVSMDIDEFLEDLDDVVESELQSCIRNSDFDLLHSGLGMGYYLLKRNKFEHVKSLILALERSAIYDKSEVKWQRYDVLKNKEMMYDLGLAHGNAAYIFFLVEAFKKGVMSEVSEKLIRGNIQFYLNNIQDINRIGAYFSSSYFVNKYDYEKPMNGSRLAWCYGDLGVLYTLLYASEVLQLSDLNEQFIGMLEMVSKRRDDTNTLIKDACFCHGTAGNGFIFYKLYNKTRNKMFLDAAEFWTRKTLTQGQDASGVCGYSFHTGKERDVHEVSLLSGLAGVAAYLLAIRYEDLDQQWAECFFLC